MCWCVTLMQSHAELQWTNKYCLAGDACGFFAFACVHWSFAKQLGAYNQQCTDTSSVRNGEKKLQMQKLTRRRDGREEHSCWGTVRNNQSLICKVAGLGTQRVFQLLGRGEKSRRKHQKSTVRGVFWTACVLAVTTKQCFTNWARQKQLLTVCNACLPSFAPSTPFKPGFFSLGKWGIRAMFSIQYHRNQTSQTASVYLPLHSFSGLWTAPNIQL